MSSAEKGSSSSVHDTSVPTKASREEGNGLSADEALLAELGYRQEFKRQFSKVELFGVSFSIIGVLPSIASVLVYAIPNGGTSAMVWGWAACAILAVFIALAMAELGSAMPTSGGLYYWTFSFSSIRWRCLLSWLVGYANTLGLIAGVASVDWGLAVQVMAAASIGSDMRFSASTGQIFAVYTVVLFSHAMICSLATRILARLQNLYIALNLLLCLAVIIAVPAATPKEFKNTTNYALGGFVNFNGWPNGYAFVLSFLARSDCFLGAYDSSVHISEEATNSRTAVPFAIISSAAIAGIVGWAINLVLAFNMGTDLENIMSSPIEQPLATIFFNSFGKGGTLALWSLIIIVQFMMGSSILLASSRQTFAFSRDGGLPLSRYIYRINPYTKTPVTGVWMAALVSLMLGLLAFAGPAAITAVFSLGVAGQNTAYSIPIAARFFCKDAFVPGPFFLGKFSFPVALIAVLWMTFMTIVVMFPTTSSPDAAGMNYTVVVLGGVLLLALAYYYFPVYGGVYWFRGPQKTLESGTASPDSQEAKMDTNVQMGPSVKASEKNTDGVTEVRVVGDI